MNSIIETYLGSARALPHVVVVGDVIVDAHVTCEVLGISPEDELAWKLRPEQTKYRPGGAANVAMNLLQMGAIVDLFGVVGEDLMGASIPHLLELRHERFCAHLQRETGRKTSLKTRYITKHGRHIARIDDEDTKRINHVSEQVILNSILSLKPDLVVVSDYAKGVVTQGLLSALQDAKIRFLVDPKRDYTYYAPSNPYVMTPNEKEFKDWTNETNVEEGFRCLNGRAGASRYILLKRAGAGAELWQFLDKDRWKRVVLIAAHRREHGDPTGCGDSTMAGLAYGLACGWDVETAARMAVAAGSVAFDHAGVYAVTSADVINELVKGVANG
jgi:rfaE bifunctional protein kinase chain/domain